MIPYIFIVYSVHSCTPIIHLRAPKSTSGAALCDWQLENSPQKAIDVKKLAKCHQTLSSRLGFIIRCETTPVQVTGIDIGSLHAYM